MNLTYTFGTPAIQEKAIPVAKPHRPRAVAQATAIIKAVADEWDLLPALLVGADRQHFLAKARHAAIALILRQLDFTMAEVAQIFARDHTSILYACKMHDQRMQGPSYHNRIQRILEALSL